MPKDEAAAVIAEDPRVERTGYGLGRHGWISLSLEDDADDERWRQVEEWVGRPTCSWRPASSPARSWSKMQSTRRVN